MSTIRIPAGLSGVTPGWITTVLHGSGALDPRSKAVILRPERIGEGIGIMGELHRAELAYEGEAGGAPSSVVVKLPSPFEANRAQGIALGMYEAEVRFYRELGEATGSGLPRVHHADIVSGTAEFVVVMEDLSHLELVDQAVGMSPDQAGAAARVAADIHAAWWGRAREPDLDWIPTTDGPRTDMVGELLPDLCGVFLERFADHLPGGGAEHARWFADNYVALSHAAAERCPTTVIHQDFRAENMLFGDPADDEVVVIDWQGVGRGPGAYDLAYVLSGSMTVDDRRANERELVEQYQQRLASHGVEYPLEQAWDAYRLANTISGLATSVFAGATLDLANERGYELIATMANRHFTAALDLDGRSLVD